VRMGPVSRAFNFVAGWPRNRCGFGFRPLLQSSVKMLVMQHAPCRLPNCFDNRAVYVPIQCGRALHDEIPGCLSDAAGENCSALNADINEMTAIWWAGKHYVELGNPDYIGFNHYRRFLAGSSDWLGKGVVLAYRWLSWQTNRQMFAAHHRVEDLDLILNRLISADVMDRKDVERYFNGHVFYPANMFAMDRETFLRYFGFVDKCVTEIAVMIRENAIDRAQYDAYQQRVYGFVLERLTSFWIWRENLCCDTSIIGCEIQQV